ncbi:HAMP domain-containing protein [Chlorogloeopsis sp. ULAP01]|uniref:HAMP domain-containing protein n=1 Tax=Chlorogloeopsis sp. ULAP01 TaxID=3056483 RepID=UPI0025AAC2DC|nr:HAMP domain-containing protein [Chlorogloeopsis sp. ULAP01]MDM9384864.1 HAMP domain-containing protein [Chlorogloeopsis sp. ULAP01]
MKQHSNFDELAVEESNHRLHSTHSRYWFSYLKVGQKIGIGYGVLLSITVLGTTIGFLMADRYQYQAHKREKAAIEKLYQVSQLKTSVFRVRTTQHQLLLYMDRPKLWQENYAELVEYVDQARQVWSEFGANYSIENIGIIYDSVREHKAVYRLLKNYKGFNAYLKRTEAFFRDNNPSKLSADEIETAQTQLFNFMHGSSVFLMDDFLDDIKNLMEVIAQEYQQSKRELLRAERLRLQIILGSLLLSIAIATLLAMYTSRAIARPIQTLTHVAQQVTGESNFDLQAPVTTNDEVGILAVSLNRLIQEVQQLIKIQKDTNEQLEVYSQALEKKVRERTRELNEKNQSLELALEELRRTQARLMQSEQNTES